MPLERRATSIRCKRPDTQLEPVAWSDLDGWADDDHAAAFATFRTSCQPFLAHAARRATAGRSIRRCGEVCRRAAAAGALDNDKAARAFFEENFRPVRIAKLGETDRFPHRLLRADRRRLALPEPGILTRRSTGARAISLVGGKKAPRRRFPTRGERRPLQRQEAGRALFRSRAPSRTARSTASRLEICWIKDPFEALFIQIQGSARVRLEDGTMLRLNYDAHNGHSYTAVGRILIERGLVPREEMSMDRIRQWMAKNPDEAKEVRGTNKSFVFFRITGLNVDDGAGGAQGVPLTPGRSIAVDRIHVYGTPFFIEAELPIDAAAVDESFPPPDGGAGHRLGDRRAGARRPLFRRRR